MDAKHKYVVVTGGTRGLGRGVVEAFVAHGARVTVVARNADGLAALAADLSVETISADVTEPEAAQRILADVRPDILMLNAGATPPMGRLDRLTWDDFAATWNSDVQAGFHWLQAALRRPLAPGSRVLVQSSGAAVNGSPLSGGYAGAKRMLWLMARYANAVSEQAKLGIRFQVVVPQQMVGGTGVGDAGALAYAQALDVPKDRFLEQFGAPLPPRAFGEHVVSLLTDPRHDAGMAFGVKGDTGVTLLEQAAA